MSLYIYFILLDILVKVPGMEYVPIHYDLASLSVKISVN